METSSRQLTLHFLVRTLIGLLLLGGWIPDARAAEVSIHGRVFDSASGRAIAGAALAVERCGTTVATGSDDGGYYRLDGLAEGNYWLVVVATGFPDYEIHNLALLADAANVYDFALSSPSTHDGPVVVDATDLSVVRYRGGGDAAMSGDEYRSLARRTVEEILELSSQVAAVRRQEIRDPLHEYNAPEIHVRGSRERNTGYYLNGISIRDEFSGVLMATVNPLALSTFSFNPSGIGSRYGNATGGIVQMTTRSGGERISGTIDLLSDNVIGSGHDQNWYSASLGGPMPGIANARFFGAVERRWLGDRSPSVRETDGFPANGQRGWSAHSRVDWAPSANLDLALTGDWMTDDWQRYAHEWYFYPEHSPRYKDQNYAMGASLDHRLGDRTRWSLGLSYSYITRTKGDGVLFVDWPDYQREFYNPRFDRHNLFRSADTVFASQLDGTIPPGSPEDTLVEVREPYYDYAREHVTIEYGVQGRLTQEVSKAVDLIAGFDLSYYSVHSFEFLQPTMEPWASTHSIYGGAIWGWDESWANEAKHPLDLAAFISARIRHNGLTLTPSIRLDAFDYDAQVFANPLDPLGADFSLGEDDLTDAPTHTRISPQITALVNVGDQTDFYISSGLSYQRPVFEQLYVDWKFAEARIDAGLYYPLPTATLEPEKTFHTETGMVFRPTAGLVLEPSVFYRDASNLVGLYHLSMAQPSSYTSYANSGGNLESIGARARVAAQVTGEFGLALEYTYTDVQTSALLLSSSPSIDWIDPSLPSPVDVPVDYEQRHKLAGVLSLHVPEGQGPRLGHTPIFENLRATVSITAASGQPYTPSVVYDAAAPSASVSIVPTGQMLSARYPMWMQVDLKLERMIEIGGIQWTPYLWITNLLDRENITKVYSGTGESDRTGYLQSAEGQLRSDDPIYGDEFTYLYRLAEQNPLNYGPPRQIYMGVKASF
ncbi:MAG: TonB-dependent receptor [candidate division Zixibacteria bacterium]|nr:TonB-dependent receptor [candidate division Zixibacteria bacterium]